MDRRGFARLHGWAKQMMSPHAARNLYANNVESRIAVARLLLEHGLPFLQQRSGPLFFVTVVSRAYVLPRGRAGEIDLFSLQQLTRLALQGCDFIGMAEASLYKSWDENGPSPGDSVSWHTHSMVVGTTRAQIRKNAKKLGLRHVGISGGPAVHTKEIEPNELEHYLLYMSKEPLKEYRLFRRPGHTIDLETGEIFQNLRQRKRPMRTGDRVRLANATQEVLIDKLLFGGGAGSDVVAAIKNEALRGFRQHQLRHSQAYDARRD